jgi:Domain of unknown function (DUF4188)
MADIIKERMVVSRDDGVVVFLIGMRINAWWKPHRWLPIALAMGRMLKELGQKPEAGFLGGLSFGMTMVQYWESKDKLLAYASDRSGQHFPAWADFYRRVGKSGDVGIWHETYVVPKGSFECLYVNMPRFGLGKLTNVVPANGHLARARDRLSQAA